MADNIIYLEKPGKAVEFFSDNIVQIRRVIGTLCLQIVQIAGNVSGGLDRCSKIQEICSNLVKCYNKLPMVADYIAPINKMLQELVSQKNHEVLGIVCSELSKSKALSYRDRLVIDPFAALVHNYGGSGIQVLNIIRSSKINHHVAYYKNLGINLHFAVLTRNMELAHNLVRYNKRYLRNSDRKNIAIAYVVAQKENYHEFIAWFDKLVTFNKHEIDNALYHEEESAYKTQTLGALLSRYIIAEGHFAPQISRIARRFVAYLGSLGSPKSLSWLNKAIQIAINRHHYQALTIINQEILKSPMYRQRVHNVFYDAYPIDILPALSGIEDDTLEILQDLCCTDGVKFIKNADRNIHCALSMLTAMHAGHDIKGARFKLFKTLLGFYSKAFFQEVSNFFYSINYNNNQRDLVQSGRADAIIEIIKHCRHSHQNHENLMLPLFFNSKIPAAEVVEKLSIAHQITYTQFFQLLEIVDAPEYLDLERVYKLFYSNSQQNALAIEFLLSSWSAKNFAAPCRNPSAAVMQAAGNAGCGELLATLFKHMKSDFYVIYSDKRDIDLRRLIAGRHFSVIGRLMACGAGKFAANDQTFAYALEQKEYKLAKSLLEISLRNESINYKRALSICQALTKRPHEAFCCPELYDMVLSSRNRLHQYMHYEMLSRLPAAAGITYKFINSSITKIILNNELYCLSGADIKTVCEAQIPGLYYNFVDRLIQVENYNDDLQLNIDKIVNNMCRCAKFTLNISPVYPLVFLYAKNANKISDESYEAISWGAAYAKKDRVTIECAASSDKKRPTSYQLPNYRHYNIGRIQL